MPAAIRLDSLQVAQDGRITVTYSDSSGEEYSSLEHFTQDAQFVESVDNAKRFLKGRALKNSPNLSDNTAIIGKTCEIDLLSGFVVRFRDV